MQEVANSPASNTTVIVEEKVSKLVLVEADPDHDCEVKQETASDCYQKAIDDLKELLRIEKNRTAKLEATVTRLTLKVNTYESFFSTLVNMEEKLESDMALQRDLYHRTKSIDTNQVAEDEEEAVELEGKRSANQLNHDHKQKKTWRRTGMKQLSSDFRDHV